MVHLQGRLSYVNAALWRRANYRSLIEARHCGACRRNHQRPLLGGHSWIRAVCFSRSRTTRRVNAFATVLELHVSMSDDLPIRTLIALELHAAIRKLGGKSDLLAILGWYGDPLRDDEVLRGLRRWNAEHLDRRAS